MLFGSPNFHFLSSVAFYRAFFRAVESQMLDAAWRKGKRGRGDNAQGSLVLEGKTVITSHFLSAPTSYSALSAATITAISTMHFHIFFFRSFHYTGPIVEVLEASHAPRNKKLLTRCALCTSLLSNVVFGVNRSRDKIYVDCGRMKKI